MWHLLGVRLKMGLEMVLLPPGISHWSAESGTSCSLCHREIRHKWSPFFCTCLSGRDSWRAFVCRNNCTKEDNTENLSLLLLTSTHLTWATRFVLFPHQQGATEAALTFSALGYVPSTCWCLSSPRHCSVSMETLVEEGNGGTVKTGPPSRRWHRTRVIAVLPPALFLEVEESITAKT